MARTLLCEHLGRMIQGIPNCSCPRKFRYKCNIGQGDNGQCVPEQHCEVCFAYSVDADSIGDTTNHLLMHIFPVRANRDCWKWNVDQIKKRLHVFNGVKLIYVATDDRTDKFEDVVQYMDSDNIEWRHMKNNPRIGEVSTWIHAWATIKNFSGYLFSCHAKGVTQDWRNHLTIKRWTELMYETCLDYPDTRNQILARNPIAASFLMHGFIFPKASHAYSGTFLWMDIEKVKDKVFNLPFTHWGIEAWPGRYFTPGCIFYEGGQYNLYNEKCMLDVEIAYEKWSQQKKLERMVAA